MDIASLDPSYGPFIPADYGGRDRHVSARLNMIEFSVIFTKTLSGIRGKVIMNCSVQ